MPVLEELELDELLDEEELDTSNADEGEYLSTINVTTPTMIPTIIQQIHNRKQGILRIVSGSVSSSETGTRGGGGDET